ncbi:MAG TPA: hypothetical protein VFY63_09315 [Pseudorhizobium sp.]|nr:hypothetical protein [Pseudorhizobium sp.]
MNNRLDPHDPHTGAGRQSPLGSPAEQPMSATEARQGRTGFPVLKVLIGGLLLVALAWGIAMIWGQSTEPPAEQTATPPAGETTPSTSEAQPSADPADAPAPAPESGTAPAN